MQTALGLLLSAFQLLTLLVANPSLPQTVRDNGIQIAGQAIVLAQQAIQNENALSSSTPIIVPNFDFGSLVPPPQPQPVPVPQPVVPPTPPQEVVVVVEPVVVRGIEVSTNSNLGNFPTGRLYRARVFNADSNVGTIDSMTFKVTKSKELDINSPTLHIFSDPTYSNEVASYVIDATPFVRVSELKDEATYRLNSLNFTMSPSSVFYFEIDSITHGGGVIGLSQTTCVTDLTGQTPIVIGTTQNNCSTSAN